MAVTDMPNGWMFEILLAAYERHDSIGIAGAEEVVSVHALCHSQFTDSIPSLLLLCELFKFLRSSTTLTCYYHSLCIMLYE